MTVASPAKVLITFEADGWTMNDACCGVLVTGATGGGKTSGPGRLLARAYLRAGMGGLVLCAKAEELSIWRELVKSENREADLVVFRPGGGAKFDFLAHEAAKARGRSSTRFYCSMSWRRQRRGQGAGPMVRAAGTAPSSGMRCTSC